MGSYAGPRLLKTWLAWLKGGGFLVRLLGLPCALLALHLEVYGSSPATTTLILHRLARRLRLSSAICMFRRAHGSGLSSFFFVGGADVMDRLPPQRDRPRSPARKRSTAGLHKDQALPSASPSGGPPTSPTTSAPPNTSTTTASTIVPPAPGSPSAASTLSSARAAMPSHTRSMSHTNVVGQGKRLSLQFPIQPAAGSNSPGYVPRSRPQSWVATPSPSTPDVLPSPTENNFLAVLAAQERYVLELKEELAKAEEDLKRVKKHWATHQAIKQRNDLRKVTQLQPLSNSLANIQSDRDDEDGSQVWMQKEMERRKALLNGTKTSQRKVFSGSRHLRTLSLLSPNKEYAPSFPQPPDVREASEPAKHPPLPRTSTSSDVADQVAGSAKDSQYDLGGLTNIQRDALLRTGKQMATDFKDGLLTFIEDIRQATVGEEGVSNGDTASVHAPRGARKPAPGRPGLNRASSSKRSNSQPTDVADDFWRENGLSEPKTAPTQKKTHALKHARTPQKPATKDDDFEEWDNWDTPADKPSANHDSDDSDAPSSPVSGQASSRTSTSSAGALLEEATPQDAKRNSIPWPDLVKLSPGNLKRTASHLMKEWEKNLTPPPEARDGSHMTGDYIGRSASPAGGA